MDREQNLFAQEQIFSLATKYTRPLQATDAGSLHQNNLPPAAKEDLGYPDRDQKRSRD